MKIENLIFHQIIKEVQGAPTLNLSDTTIPINEDVDEFASKIIKSYNVKYPTQGIFQEDKDIYSYQEYIKDYIESENDFIQFSQKSMKILNKEIDKKTTTGGYVVFLHYVEKTEDFLITIMLDKSDQFTVNDENLGIEKLKTLDIEKIARGNRLNITKWQNKNDLYLSFIKGTRGISNYFIDFIGATDVTSSKQNILLLSNNIDKFLNSKDYKPTQKLNIKEKVSDYIDECYTLKKVIELKSISAIITPKEPENFITFISENKLEASDNIYIARKADFEIFKTKKVSENGYTLKYDNKLIKNEKIVAKDGKIIINGVPDEIIKQINNG